MTRSETNSLRPPKTGNITTRDLSRLLKVSQSTVSRSLSGDLRIRPEVAERVRALAQELGYRPQPIRTKCTK